ncbi:hypothetical protein N0V82_007013 [Gnomoniopsis sp. IMI 355080]|nr:hypothetical protein N0V82_007013 [Gnomoniopsis sp. IMI 355080]
MKGTHLRRLLVAASLLCMPDILVHGKKDSDTATTVTTSTATKAPVTQTITEDTVTVTASLATKAPVTQTITENTVTVTASPATIAPVTQTVTQNITVENTQIPQQLPPPQTTPPASILPTQNPAPATTPNPVTGAQGEVFLTIALQQAALFNFASALGGNEPQGVITLNPGNAALVAPLPTVDSGSTPEPTGAASITPDPAVGAFPGGNPPNTTVDLPLTVFFLILFISGAVTHISIYRANAKRGHKFLLSDLMFDFCMVRTVTCIFRIIWVFIHPRGVVLAAQIFFNGGASVIFAVNIFLTQRIIRSMHPKFGWSLPFSLITRAMAISVPIFIVSQIVSIIVIFFSVDNEGRFDGFDKLLKVGTTYLLILATFPFWAIFLACSVPGPRPEKFGVGHLRVKTSLVMLASTMLTTGAIVRIYAIFNPRPADTNDVLYGKPVFYTTQFMLEILVVAAYAVFRFDLLFHIPNGSSKPGDYSIKEPEDVEKPQIITRQKIETRIAASGVPHQILYSKNPIGPSGDEPVYAVFFPQLKGSNAADAREMEYETKLPPRPPRRVSRRESIMEYVQQQRPSSTLGGFRSSYYGIPEDANVPPLALRKQSKLEPTSVSPQFRFDKPRTPPQPPAF